MLFPHNTVPQIVFFLRFLRCLNLNSFIKNIFLFDVGETEKEQEQEAFCGLFKKKKKVSIRIKNGTE